MLLLFMLYPNSYFYTYQNGIGTWQAYSPPYYNADILQFHACSNGIMATLVGIEPTTTSFRG